MKWIAAELHCHTRHSDGSFTTEELLKAAKDWGVDAVAVTDHNTMAPLQQLTPELEARYVPAVRGMEWTTYYGHMCVLGECRVDWRDATPANIRRKMREVRAQGGLIGIAHPFALGSPMCTGCHWDYGLADYSDVNYLEVWSEGFPAVKTANKRAVAWWQSLLDAGWQIAASYGRDWHGPDADDEPRAVTCLGVRDAPVTGQSVREAVLRGRTGVTLGPVLTMETPDGLTCGDTAEAGRLRLRLRLDRDCRRAQWERFGICPERIALLGDGGRELFSAPARDGAEWQAEIDVRGLRYVRAAVSGAVLGRPCDIALTSALYLA